MFKVKNKTKKGVRLCLFLTAWLSLSLNRFISVFDELCLIAAATCKRNFAFLLHVSGVN